MDDLDFVKRNIEGACFITSIKNFIILIICLELTGKLSSLGIDINNPSATPPGYVTDESGMLVRNLVDMDDVVQHLLMYICMYYSLMMSPSLRQSTRQFWVRTIEPSLIQCATFSMISSPISPRIPLHRRLLLFLVHYFIFLCYLAFIFNLDSPAPTLKERPWVILRRFNKRGGKKVQLPESMSTISTLLLVSNIFNYLCC